MEDLLKASSDTFYELMTGPFQKSKPNAVEMVKKRNYVPGKTATVDLLQKKQPKPTPVRYNPTYSKKTNIKLKHEEKIIKDIPSDPFIRPDKEGTWNTVLDPIPPEIKRDRLQRTTHKVTHESLTPARKRFLFLNIGDNAILRYKTGQNPPWTRLFKDSLSLKGRDAFFEGLPILLKTRRHELIKETYFHPGRPTSQYQIHSWLQKRYANIKRKEVVRVLHSLETYQRLRSRRLPKDVTGRIEVFSPGTLTCDTFYPSYKHGWRKGTIVLCCADMYSRYVGCYILEDKQGPTVARAFTKFVHSFMKFSKSPPRKLLMDKGSELHSLEAVMKTFSKDRPCVWRSLTGQPCNVIENVNANVQRKMQIYREANIISDFSDCLWLVVNSLNNEKRKDRMGFTPIELLGLNQTMRNEVNKNYKFRTTHSAEDNPLEIGNYVRTILLNRKEQVSDKTKGFPAHWSTEIYQITRRVAVKQNPGVYKYSLKNIDTTVMLPGTRFRHEILLIKVHIDEIDRTVPKIKFKNKNLVVRGTGDSSAYDPNDDL